MAVTDQVNVNAIPAARVESRPVSGVGFDMAAALLSLWFLFGMFLDGWAHNHGRVDDTFFTPWHAVLYTGVLAVAALLTFTQGRNMLRGHTWSRALPEGYGWSLVGVTVFFAGGGFDFVWHSLFGFEGNIEALLSPAHLLLASGAFLFVTGPIRAAWKRRTAVTGWRNLLPAIVAILELLSLFTFFTMYGSMYTEIDSIIRASTPSNGWMRMVTSSAGALGMMIYAAAAMGLFLMAMRRWRLPFGAMTFVLTANALLMMWLEIGTVGRFWPVLISALAAGLLGDVLIARLKPSAARPNAVRLFAFVVPLVQVLLYWIIVIPMAGTWYSVHMWLGVSFLAGVAGLLISYVAVPLQMPDNPESKQAGSGSKTEPF